MRSGPHQRAITWSAFFHAKRTGGPSGTTDTTCTAMGRVLRHGGRLPEPNLETRNSKSETNSKSEIRERAFLLLDFVLRASSLLRVSDFEFRICSLSHGSYRHANSGWASGQSRGRSTDFSPSRLLRRSTSAGN